MCGIVGIFDTNAPLNEKLIEQTKNGLNKIKHRGPDFSGLYLNCHIALGHAKLSILDFSERSNQPVETSNSVIALNGEIYNYKSLIFQFNMPDSFIDAHVISFLYDKFGIDFLSYIEGDFAIAIYDKKSNKLFLIRDRLGVKQLVYKICDDKIYFSSEVKGLIPYGIVKEPNIDKIFRDLYLWFWDSKCETYFKDIYHVNPGEYIEFSQNGFKKCEYWTPLNQISENISKDEILSRLEKTTVSRLQGVAKSATLLSGGLDSSLLTAIVAKNSKQPVFSMTIQYDKNENNIDFQYAQDVVKKYPNIIHNTVHVSHDDISVPFLEKATYHMEEVIWDKVYFSMYRNYAFAAQNGYRIVINGQGSDEVWLGYYYDFPYYQQQNLTPRFIKDYQLKNYLINDKLYNSHFASERFLLDTADKCLENFYQKADLSDHLNAIAFWAVKTYLQNNLMQEDRMSMANSVECRVPFTDYKFVEMAFSLPGNKKIENNIEKSIIKEIAKGYLPEGIVNRRKQAFVNPSQNYNAIIMKYLYDNSDKISHSYYMNKIFSSYLWEDLKNQNNALPSDLYWKIAAIYQFLLTFNFEE